MVQKSKKEVPPRLELGSLDSKSRVLTITPWDLAQSTGLFLSCACVVPTVSYITVYGSCGYEAEVSDGTLALESSSAEKGMLHHVSIHPLGPPFHAGSCVLAVIHNKS